MLILLLSAKQNLKMLKIRIYQYIKMISIILNYLLVPVHRKPKVLLLYQVLSLLFWWCFLLHFLLVQLYAWRLSPLLRYYPLVLPLIFLLHPRLSNSTVICGLAG